MLSLEDFDFSLPPELIAQHPCEKRDHSRLLHVGLNNRQFSHRQFFDLPSLINSGDLLVLNNSRTMPARLFAEKTTGGRVEVLVDKILSPYTASALLKSNRALKVNSQLTIREHSIKILEKKGSHFLLSFDTPVKLLMFDSGTMPLPPYIKREVQPEDQKRYQTIYADPFGSVATPTAGLHFTQNLLDQLSKKGVDIGFLTLHVGAGTFQKIQQDDIKNHQMHPEFFEVDETLCEKIQRCKQRKGRLIAVGTTSVRALETMVRSGAGGIKPYSGESDLFLYPGIDFRLVDGLITNFHLPKSSLYILVAAFCGLDLIRESYQDAIRHSYRFFSYGDAMLLI